MRRRRLILGMIAIIGLAVTVVAIRFGPRILQRIDWQFSSPPICQPQPADAAVLGTWSVGTTGPSIRSAASFTTLDGKVYQAGGFILDWQPSATFDRYDPATDQWETLIPLPKALHRSGLAALNGKIYLTGGFDGPFFWDPRETGAWVYNPQSNAWESIASLPSPRAAHVMVALNDRLYVVAGQGPDAAAIWVYDPAADRWDTSARAPLPEPLRDNPGWAVFENRIFLFGGRWVEKGNFGFVDVYDPAADRWERKGDMPVPRSTAAAVVVRDRIHLFGGQQIDLACTFGNHEVYDPTADTWTELAFMPAPRHSLGASLIDGKVVLVGGATGAGPRMQYHLSGLVEIWTPPES